MNKLEMFKEYVRCITDDRYEPYELQEEYIKGEYEYKKEEEPEWLKENNIKTIEEFQAFGDYMIYQDFWDFFEEDIENLELENVRIDTKKRTLGIKIIDYSDKHYFTHFDIKGRDGEWIELKTKYGDTFYYNPETNIVKFEEGGSYFESDCGYGLSFGILEWALNWKAKKRLRNILSNLSNFDLTISYLTNEDEKMIVETHTGLTFEFYKNQSSFVMNKSPRELYPELMKYEDKSIARLREL